MIERGKMEWKTRAAGIASYLGALAALAWLTEGGDGAVAALPEWARPPVLALLPAVGALLAAYVTKHRPDAMSGSAVVALRKRVRGDH